jgi:hypothetical protein
MPASAFAQAAPSGTFAFSDGSVATTYPHCGDSELCATIAYPNGETLRIYSEGAAENQPYLLHFVRLSASGSTIYEYSRIIYIELRTVLTMDRGAVQMMVAPNSDGTLSVTFAKTP